MACEGCGEAKCICPRCYYCGDFADTTDIHEKDACQRCANAVEEEDRDAA